ncbi:MAG: hypothetical protein COY40_00715 [Alphaproteobacteria bacterium CG_4_10_14_0_8_um_filter_53_9]|nr:MAG: hypothetical protein COY40_00715 [Alphaproteobacteria bacterium CG_4_10_14_0_8_um_filter_53_9]
MSLKYTNTLEGAPIKPLPFILCCILAYVVSLSVWYHYKKAEIKNEMDTVATQVMNERVAENTAKISSAYHDAMGDYYRIEGMQSDSLGESVYHAAQSVQHEGIALVDAVRADYYEESAEYQKERMVYLMKEQ